mmetsp:Transcript_31357/g.63729  ORF Transcript_31357/g.63729 Transcript_31357/m.63729 type:complete len:90 (+) Transcript_31357:1151-1420(+)
MAAAVNIISDADFLLRKFEPKVFDGDFASSKCTGDWIAVESGEARGSRFEASSGSFASCWGMIDGESYYLFFWLNFAEWGIAAARHFKK